MGVAYFMTSPQQEGVAGLTARARTDNNYCTNDNNYIVTITLSCLKITNRVGIVLTLEGEHAQLVYFVYFLPITENIFGINNEH